MQFDIVIARYKENIDWIKDLNHPDIRHIFLYNKGEEKLNTNFNNKIIVNNLPNLGREAHTYLTYCVNNYNHLPDFVIFLQGTPHHGINSNIIKDWIDSIDKNFAHCTSNYKLGNIDWFLKDGRITEWAGPINQSKYNVKEWAKIYIRTNLKEENYPIFWNACFGVSKKAILSNPIEKYGKILKEELKELNSESTHYLERLWYYLFNLDILN